MTGPPISPRCTTSPPSSGTSTPTTSPGAGTPSTRGRCAWPTSTTGWGTTTGSATSARPACRGRRFSTSPATRRSPASWRTPRPARCGASHTRFDHTSIIKTILSRFCPNALQRPRGAGERRAGLGPSPRYPGLRVAQASHLGELLTRTTPRAAPPRDTLMRLAAARAAETEASQARPGAQEEGDQPLNDLQQSILSATHKLRADGHPPDAP
jgi:hypothetical protein